MRLTAQNGNPGGGGMGSLAFADPWWLPGPRLVPMGRDGRARPDPPWRDGDHHLRDLGLAPQSDCQRVRGRRAGAVAPAARDRTGHGTAGRTGAAVGAGRTAPLGLCAGDLAVFTAFIEADAQIVTLLFVIDGLGQIIRRFRGGDAPAPPDPDEVDRLIEGLQQAQQTFARIHRAVDENPEAAREFIAAVRGRDPVTRRYTGRRASTRRAT